MSRVSIECPHCGRPTRLDLAHNLSTQKCDRCGIAFRAVNTGLAGSRETLPAEPPDWRRAKTGDWELDPEDGESCAAAPVSSGSRAAWMVAAGALVVVAVAALAVARKPPTGPPVEPMSPQQLAAIGAAEDPDLKSSYESLLERIQAATEAASEYLGSTTVEDILPRVENRDAFEPIIRRFYSEGEGKGQLPFPPFTLAPQDRQIWVEDVGAVVVSYQTAGQVPRAVALRQGAEGQWLVDWPSAAAYNEMPLADFRARRETEPKMFRLLASRDDYYNRAFANDREWVCLRLSDVSLNHRMYGYVRRGTPVLEKLLSGPLPRGSASSPMMFRLRFPDHASADDQVEIVDFLGLGWIESWRRPPGATAPVVSKDPAGDEASLRSDRAAGNR